jgi:hypothetical protein
VAFLSKFLLVKGVLLDSYELIPLSIQSSHSTSSSIFFRIEPRRSYSILSRSNIHFSLLARSSDGNEHLDDACLRTRQRPHLRGYGASNARSVLHAGRLTSIDCPMTARRGLQGSRSTYAEIHSGQSMDPRSTAHAVPPKGNLRRIARHRAEDVALRGTETPRLCNRKGYALFARTVESRRREYWPLRGSDRRKKNTPRDKRRNAGNRN